MRFNQIVENTTAGSVATVAQPMMTQTRENTNVRGLKPVQQLIKGKSKKKGPYANSIVESKVTEDDLSEQDLIVVPGQGRLKRTGFVKHDLDQGEHEGHTLKNSLHTIARAASDLDERLSVQSEFPEWVSEKIGAAKSMMVSVMDYLISSQEMQGVAEVSDATKASYLEKAKAQVKGLTPDAKKGEYKDIAQRMISRREKGIDRVTPKDVEEGSKYPWLDNPRKNPNPKPTEPEKGVSEGSKYPWLDSPRKKPEPEKDVAEGYDPGDKITWYHSNHYPEIEGTIVGWKDGHLIVKSVDPSPRNTEKTVAKYRVPKNNILSHTEQGVAEGFNESLDDLKSKYQHHTYLSRTYLKRGNKEKAQQHHTKAYDINQQIMKHPDYELKFIDDPRTNDALAMKHDTRFNEQGVAKGSKGLNELAPPERKDGQGDRFFFQEDFESDDGKYIIEIYAVADSNSYAVSFHRGDKQYVMYPIDGLDAGDLSEGADRYVQEIKQNAAHGSQNDFIGFSSMDLEDFIPPEQGVSEGQLDELNRDTVTSYYDKAEKDQDKQFTTIGKGIRDNDPKSANKAGHKFSMRSVGLNRAEKRLQDKNIAEGAMPASVIRVKEKIRLMTDAEKKEYFKGKTQAQLQQMARRHGYGENSKVYAKYATQDVAEGSKYPWLDSPRKKPKPTEPEKDVAEGSSPSPYMSDKQANAEMKLCRKGYTPSTRWSRYPNFDKDEIADIGAGGKEYNVKTDAAWDAAKKKVSEGAKVDRMVSHIEKSEEKAGKSKKVAKNIAWATANKRGMLDNKNKK